MIDKLSQYKNAIRFSNDNQRNNIKRLSNERRFMLHHAFFLKECLHLPQVTVTSPTLRGRRNLEWH